MSLTVSMTYGELCDICLENDGRPMFHINQRTRHDKNIVFVHVDCLRKKLDKAEAEAR